MPNRLVDATSPYLAQHADNPVDWHPWGEVAFAEARERDVPVFLSVGYSSCHWCHVMAHESFEDPVLAQVLNERFVNVKVDREERPDVDAVYMQAVQAMTGRGGWPMSVFLTPDGRPFYAGTYWPRTRRHGMPGFDEVVEAVADAWTDRRDEVLESAGSILATLARMDAPTAPAAAFDPTVCDAAAETVVGQAWDRDLGGFGRAPKFPQAMTIGFLLEHHLRTGHPGALEAAVHSLDAMARGGIHDQVGGGFARYSTDARWLVPHFEKMLYDNALLLDAYALAAAITGDVGLTEVAERIVAYLLGEMRAEDGVFWSATDADSEGEEGRFFVWSDAELREVVVAAGADPDTFVAFWGVTPAGNFEGANVLHEPVSRAEFLAAHGLDGDAFAADLDRVRAALHARRAQRVAPGLDDKVLCSWNAMAIGALARAGGLLDRPAWVEAAERACEALERRLVVDGRLHHDAHDGRDGSGPHVGAGAFLDDVALLADAHLALAEAVGGTGQVGHVARAHDLAADAVARFADPAGGHFQTADDAETLVLRPKETWDNATPAGDSVLAGVFARLALHTRDDGWRERAEALANLHAGQVARMATGYGRLLQAATFLAAEPTEVAVVGTAGAARDALQRAVLATPRVGTVVAVATPQEAATVGGPLLSHRGQVDGHPAVYVCHGFTCDAPVTDPDAAVAALRR
ncbi:MAG: thioredoxin domain-containing protein [Actinomycetes bacterium]